MMIVQLNTDKNIQGTTELEAEVSDKINRGLSRFVDKITRVEVHLSDQNAEKSGADDIQCKIEARLENMEPFVVVSKNATTMQALTDSIDKMKAVLDTVVGKMNEHRPTTNT